MSAIPVISPARSAVTSPLGLVGDTPVLRVREPLCPPGRGFWAKLEGCNPGGIKDRAALHMVAAARSRGDLAPGAMIVESTSGTFGLGLALAGIAYGHPVTLVADPGLEPMMAGLLTAYGARVVIVDSPHSTGGWQQARRETVERLLTEHPGSWWPDQYHNPDAPAGYAGLGNELADQLGEVDVLVCAVGTGGHSAGAFTALRRRCPGVRLVGVDTVGSTIFGQPNRTRLMRGLGSSIYPRNVDYGLFSEVHWVNAAEAVWTARQLAASTYATGGWSVGAVALVAAWLARTLPASTTIAAVFPDGPARYASTLFDDGYCRTHHLLESPPAVEPVALDDPLEQEATRWSRSVRIAIPAEARR
jgi:cysteine synthase A